MFKSLSDLAKKLGKQPPGKPPAESQARPPERQPRSGDQTSTQQQTQRNRAMPPDLSQPYRPAQSNPPIQAEPQQQPLLTQLPPVRRLSTPLAPAPVPDLSVPDTQPADEPIGSQPKPEMPLPSQANLQSATDATRQSLIGKIWDVLSGQSSQSQAVFSDKIPSRLLEAETLEDQFDQIEEILLRSDVGLETAIAITDRLKAERGKLNTVHDVLALLKQSFEEILAPYAIDPYAPLAQSDYENGLNIILVVGVNGAGKTTFIGKLAHQLLLEGHQVVIGAGDTFRAAAMEQLEVWAERSGAHFIAGKENADPASVIYEALSAARLQGADTVLLDTAGRLQNKFNLMEELRKIRAVIDKDILAHAQKANNLGEMPGHMPGHMIDTLEVLLVLDATTGQNALKQAEVFQEAVDLTGVVLTKLDGSAKGGVILSVAKDFNLPVKYVGVGEKIEDLKPFVASEFVESLFSKF
ncbi:MAG: signal recognition particle receptor subunit alpha [Vampirovibrionales bacterium]|nr:signal recognition particle receptor subunit alpha [Vampirovibrionales bacterium]